MDLFRYFNASRDSLGACVFAEGSFDFFAAERLGEKAKSYVAAVSELIGKDHFYLHRLIGADLARGEE